MFMALFVGYVSNSLMTPPLGLDVPRVGFFFDRTGVWVKVKTQSTLKNTRTRLLWNPGGKKIFRFLLPLCLEDKSSLR